MIKYDKDQKGEYMRVFKFKNELEKSIFILKPLTIPFVLIFFSIIFSCKSPVKENKFFLGEDKAVGLADQMFEAIGGKAEWCALKSLYIKAEHTEPQMVIPYQSEIWRGIDRFELVIEQQNDSFHVKGVFNKYGGTIRYYDKRDTTRVLTKAQLENEEFDHNHNVYVLLHEFGCNPENYLVAIDDKERLTFYKDSVFVCSFGLDEQSRPYLFFTPNPDGTVTGSTFTHWGTDEGLVHSAGGHPLDSNFVYRTEIWKPGTLTMKEMFGEKVFEIK